MRGHVAPPGYALMSAIPMSLPCLAARFKPADQSQIGLPRKRGGVWGGGDQVAVAVSAFRLGLRAWSIQQASRMRKKRLARSVEFPGDLLEA